MPRDPAGAAPKQPVSLSPKSLNAFSSGNPLVIVLSNLTERFLVQFPYLKRFSHIWDFSRLLRPFSSDENGRRERWTIGMLSTLLRRRAGGS